MYQPHPCPELNRLFMERPFQGADPEKAKYVFVGLDANYANDLENSTSYQKVLDYHLDGVAFWQKHKVHHPFLLPSYRGDGRRYHLNFARIGFTPNEASDVSFIELLHVPTVGRSKLESSDLNYNHLQFINELITRGEYRHVFLSAGVIRLMQATEHFQWLQRAQPKQVLPKLTTIKETRIYQHLHLSNYGKFQAQLTEEAAAINRLIAQDT
jgi:hypothetical protein